MRRALNIISGMAVLVSAFVLVPISATAAPAKAPVWEVVSYTDPDSATPSSDVTARIDISVRDGVVYIAVDADVKVEVFTILGQLVTSKAIAPGTVRLTLSQRGVYILKAAGTTKRINL